VQDGNQQSAPASNDTGQPQGQPQGAPEAKTEAEQYWHKVATDSRAKAEQFTAYEALINHLNGNPKLVDDFERLILGQATVVEVADEMSRHATRDSAAMTPEQRLAAELGLDDDTGGRAAATQNSQQPQGRQLSVEEAKRLGAAQERARQEMALFRDDMVQHGVGEHMIDEFIQYLNNPSGMTYHDLFSAWRSHKIRVTKVDPLGEIQIPENLQRSAQNSGVMPPSVSGLPGSQPNRPGEQRVEGRPGFTHRYVANPADI
jgi:hypothetical protein